MKIIEKKIFKKDKKTGKKILITPQEKTLPKSNNNIVKNCYLKSYININNSENYLR